MPRGKNDSKGFTLLEVIAVLVIIAIVALVIFLRGTSLQDAQRNAAMEALKGHIRYVQMRAMNSDPASGCSSPFGMASSGSKYYLFSNCSTDTKVLLPGASDISGVAFPSTGANSFSTFSFDKYGIPYTGSTGTGTSSTISLTIGGKQVTITKNTGFVP